MNRNADITLPVADNAVFKTNSRMAFDKTTGKAILCGENDRCVGHLTMDINAPYGSDSVTGEASIGRKYAPILRYAGLFNAIITGAAIVPGDLLEAAPEGKLRKHASGTAVAQAEAAGGEGSITRVMYFYIG